MIPEFFPSLSDGIIFPVLDLGQKKKKHPAVKVIYFV